MNTDYTFDKQYNIDISEKLLEFIDASPSCYHAVAGIKDMLPDYTELREAEEWTLRPGQGYYVVRNSSSIIAFRIPDGIPITTDNTDMSAFLISAAHSDSPAFKLKPDCEMDVEKHYTRLNVEKYGGMIMSSWFDRPLSVAGRVFTDENGSITEHLINIDRDLLIIPSVAIHMNRDINDGYKYNAQKDMLPLFAAFVPETGNHGTNWEDISGSAINDRETGKASHEDVLIDIIAREAGVAADSILGSDLFLYPRVRGTFLGSSSELIASRALDDLQCAFALIQGFVSSESHTEVSEINDHASIGTDTETEFIPAKNKTGFNIPVCAIFDNEETGSLSKQGADSTFLYDTLLRIGSCLGYDDIRFRRMLAGSFMISADNAHAVHPNHPEYADPTNRPYLNGGIVIKYNASQKYTTDGNSEARLRKLCRQAGVPVQTYVNRSDIAGGSTLGNLSNRHVSVPTVDIGLPQLSMHSCFETAGAYDTGYMIRLIREFYD